jgi:hypothetical protein
MKLVKTSDYGIKGINYYVVQGQKHGITLEELASIGVTDDQSYVDFDLTKSLQKAQASLGEHGYKLLSLIAIEAKRCTN